MKTVGDPCGCAGAGCGGDGDTCRVKTTSGTTDVGGVAGVTRLLAAVGGNIAGTGVGAILTLLGEWDLVRGRGIRVGGGGI